MQPLSSVPGSESRSLIDKISMYFSFLRHQYQAWLDWSTPWLMGRWILSLFILGLYITRVALLGGWYIVTYALGIYVLNLFIGFLSPQVDPESENNAEPNAEEAALPTARDDEFKPFIRRLPEFKFWYAFTRACVISIVVTFFPFLNIPVFWPILLIYFIALFVVTMKKQIKHMIRHKYLPFSRGKPTYQK